MERLIRTINRAFFLILISVACQKSANAISSDSCGGIGEICVVTTHQTITDTYIVVSG